MANDKKRDEERAPARNHMADGVDNPEHARRERWMSSQLRQLYDDVVAEDLPDTLKGLLDQLDDEGAAKAGQPDRKDDNDSKDQG